MIFGTVGGGYHNQVGPAGGDSGHSYSTICGGAGNTVYGTGSTIAGGANNVCQSDVATISGGTKNTANGFSVVAGGSNNNASGINAAIGGGDSNTASAAWSVVPGGRQNVAGGRTSFAAGWMAQANDDGSFVWADQFGTPVLSNGTNSFTARASGGFFLQGNVSVTGSISANGVLLTSDRGSKANFAPVDSREIVNRIAALPIQTWNYKSEDASVRHLGPTAQDFKTAFQLGSDEKRINMIDEGGVALAAIQGLHEIMKEKDAKIAELEKRNLSLESRLAAIEKALGLTARPPDSSSKD
jgi:hypothetical protein